MVIQEYQSPETLAEKLLVKLKYNNEIAVFGSLFGKSEEQLPQKTVGRLSATIWPTVGRQLAGRLLGELFFTFTHYPLFCSTWTAQGVTNGLNGPRV